MAVVSTSAYKHQTNIPTYYYIANETIFLPENAQLKLAYKEISMFTRTPSTATIEIFFACSTSVKHISGVAGG
jgi:hypothetical protein